MSRAPLPPSPSMFPLGFLPALVALLLIASGRADTNITIDDTDPRILYQPKWSFQGNTNITQDRFNKTTHFSAKQGATGSLTFSGALYVYYVGYGIMDLPSPAWIPVTLQTRNGSGSMVKCDAYRPKETRAQSVLFGSDRLNTTEIYTITVTKTNDTDDNSINIDAFILTQPEGEAVSVFSPGQVPPPVISFGATSTTTSDSSAQTGSVSNTASNTPSPNAAAIAGGVLGGTAVGIVVAFFVFRWWTKREQQKRGLIGPDVQSTSQYSDDFLRYTYFNATPAKLAGVPPPPRARMPARTNRRHRHHSVTSSFGHAPPLTPLSTTAGSASGRSEMTRVQLSQEKAQYRGNSTLAGSLLSPSWTPSHIVPPSPEDEEGAALPAYSRV